METEDDMMTPEDQAYWDGMPEETPGVPSPADNLAQALLEARVNIIMEIKGRRFDEDFEDGGYGEGFDPDEAFGETEYLSEDDFDDRMDDNEPEDGE